MKSLEFITESIKFDKRVRKHESMMSFLSLDEGKNTPDPVVTELLQKGDFINDPSEFKKSMSSSNHPEMLTDYDVAELKRMKLFKLDGYNIGFALKKKDGKFQEIVAVHNNDPNVKGVGRELIKAAIKKGGIYLDHFDSEFLALPIDSECCLPIGSRH